MTDINAKVLAAFQVEHKEQLEGIRSALAVREQDGGPAGAAALDEAFRLAHSLKGGARVCDLRPVEALGHHLEALFSAVRQGATRFDRGVVEVSTQALEAIEDWMASVAEGRPPADPGRALDAIARVLDAKPARPARPDRGDINQRVLAAFQAEHKQYLAGVRSFLNARERGEATDPDELFRMINSLKGGARIAGLSAVEALSQRLEVLFSKARDQPARLDADSVRSARAVLDAVEDAMAALAEGRSPPDTARPPEPAATVETPARAPQPQPQPQQVEMLRLSAEHLDRLLRSSGELLTESLRQDQLARELGALGRQIEGLDREWESVRKAAAADLNRLASMPEFARLSRYLEYAGQQVRAQVRQARRVRLLQQRGSWSLRILGEEVQHDVRRARMVPAESVFQGFRKMVRDLARDEGKEVDFRVEGFEVQADRLVLQALKDPLMHVLRNALIHGIEPPDERRARGKGEVGRITLRIEAPGKLLSLLVEDDGRGLDRGRVAEVAVRRGLLSESEAAACPAEELARMVFQPGFSTSRVVNELSGRGMGLSVVFETVTRLRGDVRLEERPGPGSAILITVPLSISTHRLLLVDCRRQTFAIPLPGVERLLRVKVAEVETIEGRPVVVLPGGQPVPLVSLAHLLGMDDSDFHVEGDTIRVAVLKSGAKRVAAGVDAFLAERDSIIKDLDGPAAHVRTFAGGILLEDGSVALVLNPTRLVEGYKPSPTAKAFQVVAPGTEPKAPTVLVVDDSFTTRTLEKSILEAHGYQVRIAMDGLEALDRLRAEKVDLVITDIQMPRMDGLALLQAIKNDPGLARLPVILVTSMDRREDQERGLALGADAYIVKRKFDHQDLLNTIRQIL